MAGTGNLPDPFAPAHVMLKALDDGRVSAVELLEMHIQRIERFDGAINAVVTRHFDEAREAAGNVDEARARGERGPLLGLPMTVKDCIYVQGMVTTGGLPERTEAVAEQDAPTVARLRAAGAIFMGKTNVPPYAAGHESTNPVFGRTNNPWNLDYTPGGSSGGAAAALATGMTPLEIGGDLGGSIRQPAAVCGIFGHRPSDAATPRVGHFPGGALPNAAIHLAVQGPLARSVADLRLEFDVIKGPQPGEEIGLRVELPPARHERLSDFRVAVLPAIEWLPVDEDILVAQEDLASRLDDLGATINIIQPETFGDFRDYFTTYLGILMAMSAPPDPAAREARANDLRSVGDPFLAAMADGLTASAMDYFIWFSRREEYRQAFRAFFRDWDILITPVTMVNAFPHSDGSTRTVDVNGKPQRREYQLAYPSLCNLSGHPGTAFPVGFSRDGLPVGLQAIGPYLEDYTTMRFAELVEQEFGGFQPPPGYA